MPAPVFPNNNYMPILFRGQPLALHLVQAGFVAPSRVIKNRVAERTTAPPRTADPANIFRLNFLLPGQALPSVSCNWFFFSGERSALGRQVTSGFFRHVPVAAD